MSDVALHSPEFVSSVMAAMVAHAQGNLKDVAHLLKVWGWARTIGISEGLDPATQEMLELTAIVHDIACPLCRKKYGNSAGHLQEKESDPLVREFLAPLGVEGDQLDRIAFLVSHHHTYEGVDGIDYRILLEADFLVNAHEGGKSRAAIDAAKKNFFRTETGTRLLRDLYVGVVE